MKETTMIDESEWAARFALIEATTAAPPNNVRDGALAQALHRRAADAPLDGIAATSPYDAFMQTALGLRNLLVDLDVDDWNRPAIAAYGTVHDLVAHLVGVEESLLGVLGVGPAPSPQLWPDHAAATKPMIDALQGWSSTFVLDRWFAAVHRLGRIAQASESTRAVLVNDIPTTIDGMLVLRTFELWTHHDDICRATGRPTTALDIGRMRFLSGRLMDVLPIALALTGATRPDRTMRVVLTGPGGGVYERPMTVGGVVGQPDVTIVADVVDFCRRAANRLDTKDLACTIEGDVQLAELVCAAASVFARD